MKSFCVKFVASAAIVAVTTLVSVEMVFQWHSYSFIETVRLEYGYKLARDEFAARMHAIALDIDSQWTEHDKFPLEPVPPRVRTLLDAPSPHQPNQVIQALIASFPIVVFLALTFAVMHCCF